MISVEEAQARLLALASPLPPQTLSLEQAIGHYLAENVIAKRSQPAASLSAMDGYAIRLGDLPGPFTLVGESAAGTPFAGSIGNAETARIFTGAHIPAGADSILLQEEARAENNRIYLVGPDSGPEMAGKHTRREGSDFVDGDTLVAKGSILSAGAIAATAMAGYGEILVGGMPKIKIVGTGNELVPPGACFDTSQIPSSNNLMLKAMLHQIPCHAVDFGIVKDELELVVGAFEDAAAFDIIVTSGGASVGDHDFIPDALKAVGADMDFWRVAMRPGKPVMAARIGKTIVLGLPGNPSSAFVTAMLFLLPLVRHLAGSSMPLPKVEFAPVAVALPAGDARAEYLRARIENNAILPFQRQDSGMIIPLVTANALLIRPPFAPAIQSGSLVPYLHV